MSQVYNPATGETIEFISRTPEKLVFIDRIEAGKMPPPLHIHLEQDEHFTLLEGELEVQVNGFWQKLKPNQHIVVHKGIAHTFRIPNGTHSTVQVEFHPALDSETVFRTLAKAGASGKKHLGYLGLIATQTKSGFYLANLPEFIQRPLMNLLGLLARIQKLSLATTQE